MIESKPLRPEVRHIAKIFDRLGEETGYRGFVSQLTISEEAFQELGEQGFFEVTYRKTNHPNGGSYNKVPSTIRATWKITDLLG